MNYCIYETEHGIKTAKRKAKPYDTPCSDCMLAASRVLSVLYYFPLLSETLPSTLKFIGVYLDEN